MNWRENLSFISCENSIKVGSFGIRGAFYGHLKFPSSITLQFMCAFWFFGSNFYVNFPNGAQIYFSRLDILGIPLQQYFEVKELGHVTLSAKEINDWNVFQIISM